MPGCFKRIMLGFECPTLADLDTKFSGRRPPIGPNSFIFTYILPKSAHIGGPRPLPQWVHNPYRKSWVCPNSRKSRINSKFRMYTNFSMKHNFRTRFDFNMKHNFTMRSDFWCQLILESDLTLVLNLILGSDLISVSNFWKRDFQFNLALGSEMKRSLAKLIINTQYCT